MEKINPDLKNKCVPSGEDFKDLAMVQTNPISAQKLYTYLHDYFVCRSVWEDVPKGEGSEDRRFFGFFAGYYLKSKVGFLFLQIENYLDKSKPWKWILRLERDKENKNWTDEERSKVLDRLYDDISEASKRWNFAVEEFGLFNGKRVFGKNSDGFARISTKINSFQEVLTVMENVFKCLREYAAKE